jgi:hypothetical protein
MAEGCLLNTCRHLNRRLCGCVHAPLVTTIVRCKVFNHRQAASVPRTCSCLTRVLSSLNTTSHVHVVVHTPLPPLLLVLRLLEPPAPGARGSATCRLRQQRSADRPVACKQCSSECTLQQSTICMAILCMRDGRFSEAPCVHKPMSNGWTVPKECSSVQLPGPQVAASNSPSALHPAAAAGLQRSCALLHP